MKQTIYFSQAIRANLSLDSSNRFLFPLDKINVFIGENNVGKSRMLREIFKNFLNPQRNTKTGLYGYSKGIEFNSLERIKYDLLNHKNVLTRKIGYDHSERNSLNKLFQLLETNIKNNLKDYSFYNKAGLHNFDLDDEWVDLYNKYKLEDYIKSNIESWSQYTLSTVSTANNRSIYIPILRGLRSLEQKAVNQSENSVRDQYKERTTIDYFSGSESDYIYTGLNIYEDIKRLLLGEEKERQLISEFEIFIGENVFKEKVTLIPRYGDDVLHIKLGNSEQLPIHKLGDGLQSILSIIYPVFINNSEFLYVFIEEPDAHLHPHWQRLLIKALKKIENKQYFITTHSNVFINDDSSSVFEFTKVDEKLNINYLKFNTEKKSILRKLGYRASDLMQTDYTIWVEGPTDRLYVKKFLELTDDKLIEDEHYSILMFGGKNYKHFFGSNGKYSLDLLQATNNDFGIILDSDRKTQGEKLKEDVNRIQKMMSEVKKFCWVTEKREIENYIPDSIYTELVRGMLNKKDLVVKTGPFKDYNYAEVPQNKTSYKQTIRLTDELYKQIRANGDDLTKGITPAKIRSELNKSLKATSKQTQRVDKMALASRFYNDNNIVLEDGNEETRVFKDLVAKIWKANGR